MNFSITLLMSGQPFRVFRLTKNKELHCFSEKCNLFSISLCLLSKCDTKRVLKGQSKLKLSFCCTILNNYRKNKFLPFFKRKPFKMGKNGIFCTARSRNFRKYIDFEWHTYKDGCVSKDKCS